jgi:hypothetical protein
MGLYTRVVEAYEQAVSNGYDLDIISAMDVAYDMVMYCPDLEDEDLEEVKELVIRYRSENT